MIWHLLLACTPKHPFLISRYTIFFVRTVFTLNIGSLTLLTILLLKGLMSVAKAISKILALPPKLMKCGVCKINLFSTCNFLKLSNIMERRIAEALTTP